MNLFLIIAILVVVIGLSFTQAEAKTWYVYVDDMPKHWEDEFGAVFANAARYWEEKIPGTQFHQVSFPEQAEFVVQWASQYSGAKLGYYTPDTKNNYGRPYIAITLGYMDKEATDWQVRKFNLVDADYATEITKHEIGHAIGLLHTDDPNDIMYAKIYDYQRWLENKNNQKTEKSSIIQTESKKESAKYQKWTEYKLAVFESAILAAEKSLSSDSRYLQVSVDKASLALWWAKKIFNESETMQKEAEQLSSQDKHKEASFTYQKSFNHAEKIGPYLYEVAIYLNKLN